MNLNNPILDANGRRQFMVGGHNALRTHDAGDYVVSMEWVEREPAMIICSKNRQSFAYVICLSSIGKYATPEGKPNPEGVQELANALPDFGRALERSELHHLVDVVMRHTPELILMPPEPNEVKLAERVKPLIHITEKDARGKTLHEVAR